MPHSLWDVPSQPPVHIVIERLPQVAPRAQLWEDTSSWASAPTHMQLPRGNDQSVNDKAPSGSCSRMVWSSQHGHDVPGGRREKESAHGRLQAAEYSGSASYLHGHDHAPRRHAGTTEADHVGVFAHSHQQHLRAEVRLQGRETNRARKAWQALLPAHRSLASQRGDRTARVPARSFGSTVCRPHFSLAGSAVVERDDFDGYILAAQSSLVHLRHTGLTVTVSCCSL